MFFAPPKVKSLSRYAEYGSYLGHRHFVLMLMVAMAAHLVVIAIYSILPREEVIRIPVRPLNIKLASGHAGAAAAPAVAAPAQPTPGVPGLAPVLHPPQKPAENMDLKSTENKPADNKAAESAVEKAMEKLPAAPAEKAVKTPAAKNAHNAQDKKRAGRTVVVGDSTTIAKPRKYVRGTARPEKKAAEKDGNGSSVAGVAGGQEVISRYTQVISQWIINHQAMAKAACGEAKAVTGTCNARGQAVVRLRINREGHIISNTIERTSGNELVDQAAIIMVRASDPVPAAPTNYPSDSMLEFLVAVQVDLSKK